MFTKNDRIVNDGGYTGTVLAVYPDDDQPTAKVRWDTEVRPGMWLVGRETYAYLFTLSHTDIPAPEEA